MGRFGGVENEEPSEGGVYVTPGVYKVAIDCCKAGTTRKKLDFFVAELNVLESNNPERPVGSKMAWFVGIKPDTSALGNIRAFIAEAEQEPLSAVTEEVCEYVVGEANPLHGITLKLMATNVDTRSGGKFTKCEFEFLAAAEKAA